MKDGGLMILRLIEELKLKKKHKDVFDAAYNVGAKGNTLSEILRDAETNAKNLYKIDEVKDVPEITFSALKQEYINVPRYGEDSIPHFYFRLTHPSYKYTDDDGNELDIRTVMTMDSRKVHIAPRTDEIAKMWDEYTQAYLACEKGLEYAIEKARSGEDISISERNDIEAAIDNYNKLYIDICFKEEGDYGCIIRDRRHFIEWMFRANFLGGFLKQMVYKNGAGINVSHIAHKRESEFSDTMIEFFTTHLHIAPRIFNEQEINPVYDQCSRICRNEFLKKMVDPKITFAKIRQDRIKEYQEEYDNNRYFFLDEDRMGLYRMILETGLSKEEIWTRCGFEKNGGILGSEIEYIYH